MMEWAQGRSKTKTAGSTKEAKQKSRSQCKAEPNSDVGKPVRPTVMEWNLLIFLVEMDSTVKGHTGTMFTVHVQLLLHFVNIETSESTMRQDRGIK